MSVRVGRTIAMVGVALWLALLGQAWASARVALVLGNGDYGPEIGKLKNPASDAKLVADTLKGLGFDVALVTDADQKAMKRAIREFGQKLRETGPEGIGLFYYAGHGVQVDGENYLLPIGAEIQAEGDVELEAVSATSILSQMQFAGNAVNLVFLDACRNNPLTRSFRSGTRGLARVDAPRGSFVGYSTAPGDVSVDGDSDHSPYALALVEELKQPGISIEEAHRAVRGKVLAATNQRQTPWDSSSLTGPVILAEPVALVAPTTPPAASTEAPSGSTGGSSNANQQAELLFWDSIKSSDNPATFEAYLKQFPNGIFAGLAQAKLTELKGRSNNQATTPEQQAAAKIEAETSAWSGIKDSDDPTMFEAFLKQFPDGNFAGLAQAKLDALKAKNAAPAETQSAARQIQPPAPEAAPVEIEEMSGTFVATKSVNVRATPASDAKVVAKLSADQAVEATGQVADGEWLRVAVKGKTGFVSGKLMAASDPDEVAAWSALKGAPSQASAKSFIAEYPSGYFRPKADALLVKLQAADTKKSQQATQTAEAAAPAQPVAAPVQTQEAAVTPAAPGKRVVRISNALREKVERYLKNSESFGNYYRFLAINDAGDKIGVSSCTKMTTWMTDACGGATSPYDGAKRVALKECGSPNECHLIFEGPKKIGDFDIEWY
jgi:uncharacterized caspase-like protein